jgi:hypothetical protein
VIGSRRLRFGLLFHQRRPSGTDVLTNAAFAIPLERLIGFSGRLGLLGCGFDLLSAFFFCSLYCVGRVYFCLTA